MVLKFEISEGFICEKNTVIIFSESEVDQKITV